MFRRCFHTHTIFVSCPAPGALSLPCHGCRTFHECSRCITCRRIRPCTQEGTIRQPPIRSPGLGWLGCLRPLSAGLDSASLTFVLTHHTTARKHRPKIQNSKFQTGHPALPCGVCSVRGSLASWRWDSPSNHHLSKFHSGNDIRLKPDPVSLASRARTWASNVADGGFSGFVSASSASTAGPVPASEQTGITEQ